jgi:HD-GYP domain-containing protein (c-di-GMP phosphodiesterase class II)/DNA-binding CsgD family transcriptional regulator
MGLPLETGLATCLVAMRLGDRLGLDPGELRRTYHLSLLQHIGCTTASATVAEVVGDEMLMREHAAIVDFSDQGQMLRFMLGHVSRANPFAARPLALVRAFVGGPRILATADDICEAAMLLGTRCGYAAESIGDIGAIYESWDGSGLPGRVSGEQIPLPTRVVQVASLAVNAERLLGAEATSALLRSRSGGALAPAVVDAFVADPAPMLAPLAATESLWDAVMAAEPAPERLPDDADVDAALAALADFADLKSHWLVGHSRGVAALGGTATRAFGLSDADAVQVSRAGLVHDIGRVGISSGIWDASRPLKPDELERLRMHPYHTQQVLSRTPYLRSLAEVASCHHERLDGSGYFRGLRSPGLSATARVLAAADAYHTKTEPRPHRAALSPAAAADHVRAEAAAGRLDAAAVEAVLVTAGAPVDHTPRPRLTAREIEILGEVARGGSMREIARALSISPKTVDGHLQRIYPKIGVSTRAGATLYALEHGLVAMGENSP